MKHLYYIYKVTALLKYFPFCPNVLRRKPNQITSPSEPFSPNSALNHALSMCISKENVHCLFLGLTEVGRPNQNVLLGFILSVLYLSPYDGVKVKSSNYLQNFREKQEMGLYTSPTSQTIKLGINNEM